MQIMSAKVVGGRLDLPDDALPEGTTVTLLVPDAEDSGFVLSEAQRAELAEAIAQADRGEGIDGWELLRDLKS